IDEPIGNLEHRFWNIAVRRRQSEGPRQNIRHGAGLSRARSRLIVRMPTIQLSVNGHSHSVSVDPDVPLLWVLRDTLQLRGTKFGCGRGICGACTVLIGGTATRSCMTTAVSAARQPITTIEGIAGDRLHLVQQAWIDEDVPQ